MGSDWREDWRLEKEVAVIIMCDGEENKNKTQTKCLQHNISGRRHNHNTCWRPAGNMTKIFVVYLIIAI